MIVSLELVEEDPPEVGASDPTVEPGSAGHCHVMEVVTMMAGVQGQCQTLDLKSPE